MSRLTERCSCGATFEISSTSHAFADEHNRYTAREWRIQHKHEATQPTSVELLTLTPRRRGRRRIAGERP